MAESHGRWRHISTSRASVNPWFHYRHDEIVLPDGSPTTYAYQDHAAAVIVVPVTAQGQVVLLRQYRYPVDDWCYEVPAGGVVDGETLEEAAVRELREEAGGRCQELMPIGAFYGLPGSCNARFTIFLALGVALGESAPEPTEELEVHCVDIGQAIAMAREGAVSDGPSAVALLRCEHHLQHLAKTAKPPEQNDAASA